MVTNNPSGSGSLISRGTVSINSVYPEEKDADGPSKKEPNLFNEDLFSANAVKCSKSFYVNVRDGRIIHIQKYALNADDQNKILKHGDEKDSSVVLFFLHGVGGSYKIWDPQIQYFVHKGYEIIALDMLGHGLSSKPNGYKPYVFSELAADVLFIFDKFCKHRNILVGHSYGTSFCVLLSKERRNLVSKMVLISGGGPTTLMPDGCSAFCLPFPLFFLIQPSLLKIFRRMAFHVETSKTIRRKITTFDISAHVLKAIMQGQLWDESDEQYHIDLSVPSLLIYGRGDQFVSLSDEVWMNETIYSSTLEIIDNAGHMVMIETPAAVNTLIHKFLNRDANTRIDQQCNTASNNTLSNSSQTQTVCDSPSRELRDSSDPTDIIDLQPASERSSQTTSRLSRTSLRGSRCWKKMY